MRFFSSESLGLWSFSNPCVVVLLLFVSLLRDRDGFIPDRW